MSKYFKTSDGEQFYTENHAQSHARSLEDKTVTPPAIEVEESIGEESEVKLTDMTKAQLIAFAADNELTVDPKATNAKIIEAIELQLTPKTEE
jgi:hypothetical protein